MVHNPKTSDKRKGRHRKGKAGARRIQGRVAMRGEGS
jgi:hypothetical protein